MYERRPYYWELHNNIHFIRAVYMEGLINIHILNIYCFISVKWFCVLFLYICQDNKKEYNFRQYIWAFPTSFLCLCLRQKFLNRPDRSKFHSHKYVISKQTNWIRKRYWPHSIRPIMNLEIITLPYNYYL